MPTVQSQLLYQSVSFQFQFCHRDINMFLYTCSALFIFHQHVMVSYGFNNTLHIKIQTDGGPSSSNNNTIIDVYNDYDDGTFCAQTSHHISIPDDGCFTLQFYDTYGDGICCSFGYGRYEVQLNDAYLAY